MVPVLELDDGATISEAIAICHYLEAVHPEPALMGHTPAEKAEILMWEHRCEIDGFLAVQEAFRNSTPGLQERAVTGREEMAQIPALAERGRSRVLSFFRLLEERLAQSPYLGGPSYSIADITAWSLSTLPAGSSSRCRRAACTLVVGTPRCASG
jgi:glutathione S-transferase